MEEMGWRPRGTRTKAVLRQDDNAALSAWQRDKLRLTWCVGPEPWNLEGAIIGELAPPLNCAENQRHPLYDTVKAARRAFRLSAKSVDDVAN
jgi:hypothetical protein